MSHPFGEALFAELLWVHGLVRQDLEEDRALFPALRAADPDLGPLVDRLEGDHRRVAEQLDELENAVAALDVLAEHLLAHLELEEESIGPALRRMDRHPLSS